MSGYTQREEEGVESNNDKDELIRELLERIDELESTIEDLLDWKEGMSNWTESNTDRIAEVEDRIEDVEGTSDPSGGGGNVDKNQPPEGNEPETPLENFIRLPEEVVQDNLTANQERARFVAKDIVDYSKSVPAGRAIKSSELRRVLSAKEDKSVHTETVSRVMDKLDKFGKSDVQVKETRSGERVVVFSEAIVKRIVAYRNMNHTVVTGAKA